MSSQKRLLLFVCLMSAATAFIALVNTRLGVRRGPPVKPPAARGGTPRIQVPDMNGGMWKLSDQRGKVVLVNFWATWCGPCREEIPDLGRIARRFRGTDFELVGIAMDESGRKVVKDFVERSGIEYKVLLPSREEIGASGVDSLPTTYLVDRKGRVAKVLVGLADAREITENIQQLLAEQ